jgi:hypothetical protein
MKTWRLACALVVALLAGSGCASNVERDRTGNTLGNPAGMVDRLEMIDTAEELGQGTRVGVNLVTENGVAKLVLHEPGNRHYPRRGSWTSDEIEADCEFTELIPSWNVQTPANTGLWILVRVKKAASGEWSPWLYMGQWGRTLPAEKLASEFSWGWVNMDNLVLKRPASAFQVKVDFQSYDLDVKVNPSVRRVAISYSGVVNDPVKRAKLAPATQPVAGKIDLAIPYRPQGDNGRSLAPQTCSPTSTSMVMAYWGADRPTLENCVAIWDNENHMFGNWGRAVARAGEMGLDAWIARYRDWDHVKATLATGQPIIASIKFNPGEFPSSLLKESKNGHLIVIRGMTEAGDVICNDPGNRKGDDVVYKADELGRAWFGHGGVAYIIHGKTPAVASSSSAK